MLPIQLNAAYREVFQRQMVALAKAPDLGAKESVILRRRLGLPGMNRSCEINSVKFSL